MLVILCENSDRIGIAWIVPDLHGRCTFRLCLGLMMTHRNAPEIAAVIFSVENEVKPSFYLIQSSNRARFLVSIQNLPAVHLCRGNRPRLRSTQLLLAASSAKPHANRIDKEDPAHWLNILIRLYSVPHFPHTVGLNIELWQQSSPTFIFIPIIHSSMVPAM